MHKEITYSPSYTIVPTYECFNRCSYCNFRVDIGQGNLLTLEQAEKKLDQLRHNQVSEILILSGEFHPHSANRKVWFERIYDLCLLVLEKGYLPHTNVGPLTKREMEQLKQVNISLGLMLEQVAESLESGVHRYSPSKKVNLRLEQLNLAGKLKIPFTTGLLFGIGEDQISWWKSLEEIAKVWQKWGHIQEVILQPHSPEPFQQSPFELKNMPYLVKRAREILPDEVTIQIPPNLITNPQILLECLDMGARDLGGIGPIDEVNPTYSHVSLNELTDLLDSAGWKLKPRLPIYERFYDWLPESLRRSALWRSSIEKTDLNFKPFS